MSSRAEKTCRREMTRADLQGHAEFVRAYHAQTAAAEEAAAAREVAEDIAGRVRRSLRRRRWAWAGLALFAAAALIGVCA